MNVQKMCAMARAAKKRAHLRNEFLEASRELSTVLKTVFGGGCYEVTLDVIGMGKNEEAVAAWREYEKAKSLYEGFDNALTTLGLIGEVEECEFFLEALEDENRMRQLAFDWAMGEDKED